MISAAPAVWCPRHLGQQTLCLSARVFRSRQGAGSAPLYRLSAHDKATCALSFCPAVPGLLATSSTDKKVGAAQGAACWEGGHRRCAADAGGWARRGPA